jgi:hypothetical protein
LAADFDRRPRKSSPKPGKRCFICRKGIDKTTTTTPISITLQKKDGGDRPVKLLFDKKQCLLIFEKLRRFYGDDELFL